MYCKLFASLYQGTLRGRAHEILVFTNLLAHCDSTGMVDKHPRAIAEEVGLTVDEVKAALITLESPDEESRSPELDGARISRIDAHRSWGWLIVNHAKYSAIRNAEDRKEQNRISQQKWRERKGISKVSQNKPESANTDTSKDKDKDKDKDSDTDSKAKVKTHLPASERGIAFAEWFRTLLPDTINLSANWKNDWAKCYDQMIALDNRTPEEITKVCRWARADNFWQSNFMAPPKLRKANGEGVKYFDVFLAKSSALAPTEAKKAELAAAHTAPLGKWGI